jgi:hypothetical protein
VPWHNINLHDGVKMGLYGNPSYVTRKDRRRWTNPKCFRKVFHSSRTLLFHGIHDRCFGWRIRRQRRDRRPRGRICQNISSWLDFVEKGSFPCSTSKRFKVASGSGSTRVLIAREICTCMYSLPMLGVRKSDGVLKHKNYEQESRTRAHKSRKAGRQRISESLSMPQKLQIPLHMPSRPLL